MTTVNEDNEDDGAVCRHVAAKRLAHNFVTLFDARRRRHVAVLAFGFLSEVKVKLQT